MTLPTIPVQVLVTAYHTLMAATTTLHKSGEGLYGEWMSFGRVTTSKAACQQASWPTLTAHMQTTDPSWHVVHQGMQQHCNVSLVGSAGSTTQSSYNPTTVTPGL